MAALLASALAGVLVAASLGGSATLVAAVALVQALVLLGLALASGIPAARTSSAVAFVAGVVGAVLLAANADGPLDPDWLTPVLATIGAGFVVLVIVQLARRDGRVRLTASLTLGVTGLLLVASATLWLGLGTDETGTAMLLLGLSGAATAAAIAIFPGPLLLWAVGGTIGAASVGLIMQTYVVDIAETDLTLAEAALVAGSAGLAAVAGIWVARLVLADRTQADAPPSTIVAALLTAALPVVLAAPATYAAAWAVTAGLVA